MMTPPLPFCLEPSLTEKITKNGGKRQKIAKNALNAKSSQNMAKWVV
jgi:hypothetical protein